MELVKPAAQSSNDVAASDPYDLGNLRLSQSFTETAGVKKLLTTVPVRKPHKQDFVRVHPSEHYRADVLMVELKEDREAYLVSGRQMVDELATEAEPFSLFTAINRQGVVFLWPVRLPTPDGKVNEWHRSLREAAETATGRWCRVKANMSLGAYETTVAESAIADPAWPEASFQELIRIGFRDRLIDVATHPVVKRLRGLP
jgi:hypothetical protein